jgi:hypothetical protein
MNSPKRTKLCELTPFKPSGVPKLKISGYQEIRRLDAVISKHIEIRKHEDKNHGDCADIWKSGNLENPTV